MWKVLITATVILLMPASIVTAEPAQYLCIVEHSAGLTFDRSTHVWKSATFTSGQKYILRPLKADDLDKLRIVTSEERMPGDGDLGFFEFGKEWPDATCKISRDGDFSSFECQRRSTDDVQIDKRSLRFEIASLGAYRGQGWAEKSKEANPQRYEERSIKNLDFINKPDDLVISIGRCDPF